MTNAEVHERFAKLLQKVDPPQTLPSPNMPHQVATVFLERKHFSANKERTLYWWRKTWMIWRGSHWEELSPSSLRALLYNFTTQASYRQGNESSAWAPTTKKINDLIDALASLCELPDKTDAPSWLDNRKTGTIVAVANGLLDLESLSLYPHTPQFFNLTATPIAYDPAAPAPKHWFWFLDSLWPSSDIIHPAQNLLQE